ncbi:MAG: 3'-5' exoribonuclease YhaM family protein [Solirubrobacteraceae bacterium]
MELIGQTLTTCDVRDLQDGSIVDQVLLVREREIRHTRAGAVYVRLALADRTGVVAAIVWDDVEEAAATAVAGEPVRVIGSFSEHRRYGPQITVQSLLAPFEVDWERLLDAPAIPTVELERKLDAHIAGLRDPHLAALMERLLGTGSSSGRAFRRAFAAQYNHHAYRCGLLEHSLQVADATADAARTFAGIDRDTALCGALLHDIGKLDAYSGNACGVNLNDGGRLIGEIPSGYYTVRREIEQIPGFPPERAQALLHIILSHHGCLEHGSPVLPSTREALVVHAMDKLSGDLGSFDRLARETAEDEAWSRFDRALGRAVLLGGSTSPQTDELQ